MRMDVTVQDMMEAREWRAHRQSELLKQYGKTLLCFTMNIPGPEKDNALIREGFSLGKRRLRQAFLRLGTEPVCQEERLSFTGCEAYYVLPLSPLEAKRMTADIEEADTLGRLFDLDVLNENGRKVDRQEIGLPGRPCLICGGDARACARSRCHTVEELRTRTRQILAEAVAREKVKTVAVLACRALLNEVMTTPKPGLVDRANNGSHQDMDTFTFAASASALYPYFETCARIGMETADMHETVTFDKIRLPGRLAEGEMMEATHGVNTHRGAIFSMGILCAAAGRLERTAWQADRLLAVCGAMTAGLTKKDFTGLTASDVRTFGQKLYLEHGITGVRGEAEQGFPLVGRYGYPKLCEGLQSGLSLNDAGCAALTAIMAHNVDTNVIRRSSLEMQEQVQLQADQLLRREPFPSVEALADMDRMFIKQNISPGGSADLLAMCYMLHDLEEETK